MVVLTDAQLQAWLAAFLLPFFRILALLGAAPVLSIRAVPARTRIGLSVLLAATVAPSVAAPVTAGADALLSWTGLGWIAREVAIGIAIGFAARLVFAAFDLAGEVIGLQMGLSFAGFFDPQGGTGNAVAAFMNAAATLLFVSMNGPLMLIVVTLRSFVTLPVGGGGIGSGARFDPLALGAEVFALGLLIATPFLAMILFINLLLGVMSRVAPQLSLFSIGFPMTIGVGMLLLVVGIAWIEAPMTDALGRLFLMFGP